MNETFASKELHNKPRIMTLSPKIKENCNINNNNNNYNKNITKNDISDVEQTSNNNSNTESTNLARLQLTFSVDRLLNNSNVKLNDCDINECTPSSNGNCNRDIIIKRNDINLATHQHCACTQCTLTFNQLSQQPAQTQMLLQNEKFIQYTMNNLYSGNKPLIVENLKKHLSSTRQLLPMDIKNIVRPTPLRAVSNNNGNVFCNSLQSSSLYNLHYQTIQQKPTIGLIKSQNYVPSANVLMTSQALSNSTYTPYTIASTAGSSIASIITTTAPITITTTSTNQMLQMKNHFSQFDVPLINPTIVATHTLRSQGLAETSCLIRGNIKGNQELNVNNGSSPNSNSIMSACCGEIGGASVKSLSNGKRKRSWSRAVFSNLQRKGLEIQFQQQKYITKPDRRKLAARLNLTDAQVKVWFQNRRMKWRHTRENVKSGHEKPPSHSIEIQLLNNTNLKQLTNNNSNNISHMSSMHYSSDETSDSGDIDGSDNDMDDHHNDQDNDSDNDEDEIDVVQ